MKLSPYIKITIIYFLILISINLNLTATVYEVGKYNNPRNDFTLRIKDPFPQDNPNLIKPVQGIYKLKVLPPQIPNLTKETRYNCEG